MLRKLNISDLEALLPFVSEFHDSEKIEMSVVRRQEVLKAYLENEQYGQIYFIENDSMPVGYLAIAYGYSIELGGRDAMIDEIYVREAFRGRGFARSALTEALEQLFTEGIVAISLEVDNRNEIAQNFYHALGFRLRERYQLMSVVSRQESNH